MWLNGCLIPQLGSRWVHYTQIRDYLRVPIDDRQLLHQLSFSLSSSLRSLPLSFFVSPSYKHSRNTQQSEEDDRLAGEEISASGRMALADFLLGTSDVTSPASASVGRVGSLATVMEEGPLTGALALLMASALLGLFGR